MVDLRKIEWVQQWRPDGAAPDVTIWIDVVKLDQSWQSDAAYYVAPGGGGGSKYERFGSWISHATEPVRMPHVSVEAGGIYFTDGRHRFAWFRDRGLRRLPVTVEPDLAAELDRLFGCT